MILIGFLYFVFEATQDGKNLSVDFSGLDGVEISGKVKLVMASLLSIAIFAWLIIVIFANLCSAI